jgi:hypothetical protein
MLRIGAINLAVLAALSLALLAAAEGWLRLTIAASSSESIYAYTLDTPRYKVMRPGAAVSAWGTELRTNALGFRDDTVAPKQPGEYRIAVLGDSFTVAAGVPFEELYTRRLERALRVDRPQTRVLNLAVGGYNIVQYGLVLKEAGLALRPDLVLVALFPDNDFSMETYDENRAVAEGRRMPPQPAGWPWSLYVYQAYGTRAEAKLRTLLAGPATPPAASAARGWDENAAALREIARVAAERGIGLTVALLPNTWRFERERALFARVEALCRELQVKCANLLERFIAARIAESSLRLNAIDSHPNARYQALVAAELAIVLTDSPASTF